MPLDGAVAIVPGFRQTEAPEGVAFCANRRHGHRAATRLKRHRFYRDAIWVSGKLSRSKVSVSATESLTGRRPSLI